MSEIIRNNESRTSRVNNKAAAAILALGLLTGGVATKGAEKLTSDSEYAVNHEIATKSISEAAEQRITHDLAARHHLDVAKDVRAIVSYSDGSKIRISNPIIEKIQTTDDYSQGNMATFQVAVAERTRGSDPGELSVVTAYTVGERGVTSISYHGTGLHPDGEKSIDNINLTPMPLERAAGLSHEGVNNFFVVVPTENNPGDTDIAVAQGTLYVN